ncbi:MAG: Asp-tRNA(Asn)/Glu-tRNA(Gln) amidotransferase subunit GatC [Parcubacteria group bacterium]
MDKDKVLNLAKLARIELGDKEAENLTREFAAVLDYVGEVKEVDKFDKSEKFNKEEFPVRNVMREDAEPHESGLYTKKILEQAPAREGGYIKVKKIL